MSPKVGGKERRVHTGVFTKVCLSGKGGKVSGICGGCSIGISSFKTGKSPASAAFSFLLSNLGAANSNEEGRNGGAIAGD